MEIMRFTVGQLQTNCFLAWDEPTSDCYIIDPGDDADFITTELVNRQLKLKAILLTHGHFDHCLGCLELKLNFNVPIFLDPKDNFLYNVSDKSATHWTAVKTLKQPPTSPFPKELKLGDHLIEVISTPGHTPGSVCFYSAPHLFVGDTIFEEGVGRTDFSYSSSSNLDKSIAKILSFPEETLIYSGHENSPFFLSSRKDF